jgi:benzoyl-CoA reductase/2-hydroxyglutaryl-CoA dehydratase subunit BcrC/BadD/HgdB
MNTIIYSCPYVPAEWIAAHHLRPSRIMPERIGPPGPFALVEGLCPYVHSFVNEVLTDKSACGVIVTTLCDQMRRGFDILVRKCKLAAFLMNVPHTWQSVNAQRLYVDELMRLGRFLVRLGGKSPSDRALSEVMLEYDAARASIRAARGYLSARRYAEAIAGFGCDGPSNVPRATSGDRASVTGVPLAIIGGPLVRQDLDIFDIVEQFGGRIILDATETGERGMPVPFDRRRVRDEPLIELARAYFDGIPDASRRPNSELYKWFKNELAGPPRRHWRARGVIFRRYVWCDTWHAELCRMRDWVGLPLLDIDVGGGRETHRQRAPNRIRSFLETLQ